MFKNQINQSGQALLTVVLTMMVTFIMALIIFMNSLSGVKLTTTEEQSERAFNASEAGIEELLATNLPVSVGVPEDLTTEVRSQVSSVSKATVTGQGKAKYYIKQNDSGTVFLPGNSSNPSQYYILWADRNNPEEYPSPCNPLHRAALIIEFFGKSGSTDTHNRFVLNPNTAGCQSVPAGTFHLANATPVNQSVDTVTYGYRYTLNLGGGTFGADGNRSTYFMMRIRPIFNGASVRVSSQTANNDLPIVQQHQIETTGTAETEEARAIEVVKSVPQLPSIFDYVLFSKDQPIIKPEP